MLLHSLDAEGVVDAAHTCAHDTRIGPGSAALDSATLDTATVYSATRDSVSELVC